MSRRIERTQGGGDSQAATLDSLSKKLSDDLRQHIKSLGSYSLLSKEWLGTVRSLPPAAPPTPRVARSSHRVGALRFRMTASSLG